ncbi:MAG: Arylsulfatase [Verrucomicrobiota bacterium]
MPIPGMDKIWILAARVVLAAILLPFICQADPSREKPNILLIVADDLGARDLQIHGSDLHTTPNLDGLAAEGIEFTCAYSAAPVCSPTRASIMTGKHPARLHMTTWHESSMNGPRRDQSMIPAVSEPNLPLEEITLAECFKDAGYHTFHVGKWHLGEASTFPEVHGFDVNIAGHHWGAPPTFFAPYKGVVYNEMRYVPGLHGSKEGEYLPDRLTTEAIELMKNAGDTPFFLNLCYFVPHVPIEGKSAYVEEFASRVSPGNRHRNPGYAAMVKSLDDGIGRILEWLEQSGKDKNTVVIFVSDNGGFTGKWDGETVTSNAPLRAGKGTLYEGGIRIPWFMRIPGLQTPDKVDVPVTTTDILPTLLDLAGLDHPASDGASLKPLLHKENFNNGEPRSLVFHFPHYYEGTTPVSVLRKENLKLLQYYTPEGFRFELYDLSEDPGESNNLAEDRGAIVKEMSAELNASLREMGANFPSINSD